MLSIIIWESFSQLGDVMGRNGTTTTLLNTSVSATFVRLIDCYIEYGKKKTILRRKISRARVIEDAVLLLLDNRGLLKQLLQEIGVSAEEAENTIKVIRVEYGSPPKSNSVL